MTDDDLIALVADEVFQPQVVWKLGEVQVCIYRLDATVIFQFFHYEEPIVNRKSFSYHLQVTCGSLGLSTATVKLINDSGEEHIACSVGTGPVDSAYKAVDLIVKV